MQLIFEDKQKRAIKDREQINFSSFSSFHLISVTARTRSAKQISKEATDDEDLIVKIDSKIFPVSAKNKRLINSPAAFSGGKLHNLSKTVFFLTFLKGKDHTVTLITDKPHDTATFESLEVYTLELDQSLTLKIEKQAEDGDRRPWITFALENFPLASVTPTITYFRRKRDQRWAGTYHGVILQPNQYEPFSDPESEIFKRITDQSLDNPLEKKAWEESSRAAEQVISGMLPDPTNGANHFYATTIAKPYWADESKFTLQIGIIRFYKL